MWWEHWKPILWNFQEYTLYSCIVAHTKSKYLGGKGRRISEFKVSLVYRMNFRTIRTIQWDLISKQNKNNTHCYWLYSVNCTIISWTYSYLKIWILAEYLPQHYGWQIQEGHWYLVPGSVRDPAQRNQVESEEQGITFWLPWVPGTQIYTYAR